jgi:glutathione S-transferase
MKLYITPMSPYARLARIVVLEKKLSDKVEIVEAKTRSAGSPYYQINPSGRVPYLVTDAGIGMEDSQLICAYLDNLDGRPRFHHPSRENDWSYRRLEVSARSMCDGISVWTREMQRPANERSPTALSHEAARMQRMADFFDAQVALLPPQGPLSMAHLILTVALESAQQRGPGSPTDGRPHLAAWLHCMFELPSVQATALPQRS